MEDVEEGMGSFRRSSSKAKAPPLPDQGELHSRGLPREGLFIPLDEEDEIGVDGAEEENGAVVG